MRLLLVLSAALAVASCTSDEPAAGESSDAESALECCTVTVRATVPEGTGTVYLSGNVADLGPWEPDGLAMTGDGVERVARVQAPAGAEFEYKFTLGTWDNEALDPDGQVPDNHRLLIEGDVEATHEIAAFKDPMRLDRGLGRFGRRGPAHLLDGRRIGVSRPRTPCRSVAAAGLRRQWIGPLSRPLHERRTEPVRPSDRQYRRGLGRRRVDRAARGSGSHSAGDRRGRLEHG